ncbi:hypothetical protein B0T17DRAFT_611729 [Bombardia bombarda]|uniref:Uncharacterized protein n=1 Tax=Bombardia bombarda TaxID=252184 RepID=A0AA39XIX7_9PEZI|nr:hypothetical protein B0T17DRAFT_611729 [Bombardia bombarda]
MSGAKEPKWNDDAHAALCGALAESLLEAGSQPSKHKDTIMAFMAAMGQQFTWEGIRLFVPNAADCRTMISELHQKGYNYSENALL